MQRLKVFWPNLELVTGEVLEFYKAYQLFLHIESDKWIRVDNIADADVIPTFPDIMAYIKSFGKLADNQLLIVLDIFHAQERMCGEIRFNFFKKAYADITDNVVVITTNLKETTAGFITYDFLFNRQRCYFMEFNDLFSELVWTFGSTHEMYKWPYYVAGTRQLSKKCLSLSRIYGEQPRMSYRTQLLDTLKQHAEDCYISDPANDVVFPPNTVTDKVNDELSRVTGGTWYPVADQYYKTSAISIYVETITIGQKFYTVTEKTFDPLIKGHFILPFGNVGMIQELIVGYYGFKLPTWIDYSYDSIENDDDRFAAFLRRVNKVLQMPLGELQELVNKDKDLLLYNRDLFITRNYDSLHNKILGYINESR